MSKGNFQITRVNSLKLDKIVVTSTYTANTGRVVDGFQVDNPIDVASPAANFTLTIPSGAIIGQELLIVMSANASSTECTVSITNHVTSDPEELFLNAADESILLLWTGTEWVSVYSTASTSTGG